MLCVTDVDEDYVEVHHKILTRRRSRRQIAVCTKSIVAFCQNVFSVLCTKFCMSTITFLNKNIKNTRFMINLFHLD